MARKSVKKKSKRVSKKTRNVRASKQKFDLVLKNLVTFLILFLVSLFLYSVSRGEASTDLFLLLSFIFGFVILAFLLVLLVFLFMRIFSK